uniref:Methyltransferase FkbM domain-containing protein n=1 Tax=Alexandrium monilatum TaxID=311494 RepID=A0A7S4Q526_9DINO
MLRSCEILRGRLRFEDTWCRTAAEERAPQQPWPRQVDHSHADTQESLFDQLLTIWSAERPRLFVDVGASAGGGFHRNASDVHFFRDRFPQGETLAVEMVAPFAEMLSASFAERYDGKLRLDVANVFLDVEDDPEPRDVVLDFPPVVRGRSISFQTLLSCCQENARHPHFMQLHAEGVQTFCSVACAWKHREDGSKWRVPRVRWDSLWQSRLGRRKVDFIKVDFDPGHAHWQRHLRRGWRDFFDSRAFSVMTLELDERAYYEHLREFLEFMRARDYYVFLKWPCTRRRFDGDFQTTAYVPLTDPLMEPLPASIAAGLSPQDLLVLDRRQPELFRLVALGNAACGTNFPEPRNPWPVW